MFTLPLLEWCAIPSGEVTIIYQFSKGVVDHIIQYDVEQKQYHVEAFKISKYPVTNAQYRAFIRDEDGYAQAAWWDYLPAAVEWRKDHVQAKSGLYENDTTEPKAYTSKRFPPPPPNNPEERPRELVSWYDAMAFCRWLSGKTQMSITLPTEQEWQWAAQGGDNRVFPWGNEFDELRCNNSNQGFSGKTTPVTRYPTGISPFGVYDMAGNVEEWCLSEYNPDKKYDSSTYSMHVFRGGSFNLGANGMRVDNRGAANPDYESGLVGFRLALHQI